MPQLSKDQAKYIAAMWRKSREAHRKAEQHSRNWNRINDEINDLLNRQGDMDIASRTKVKGLSIPLNDEYTAGKWWAGEAQRIAAAIQTEYLCIIMMQGGVVWESPLEPVFSLDL